MSLILIVEDNEKNLKLVRDVLRVKGYATIEATNAEDGIALANAHKPDLILMDIQLPGMNGIDALRVLRADSATAGIPAIAGAACDFRRAEPYENIHPPGWDKLSESVISPFTKLTGPVWLGKLRLGRTAFYQIREMECDSSGVILSNIDMPQSESRPATGRAGGSARSSGGAGFRRGGAR